MAKQQQKQPVHPTLKGNEWVLYPSYKWVQNWDVLFLTVLIYYTFAIPYMIGISGGYYMLHNLGWLIVNLTANVIFIIDMFMHFFRAYYDDEGIIVYDLKKIARNYGLSRQFVLNLISCFPTQAVIYGLDRAIFRVDSDVTDQSFLMFVMIDSVKLLRILQINKLAKSSSYVRTVWEKQHVALTMLLVFTVKMVLFCHWLACFWSFIAFVQAQTFDFTSPGVRATWISVWYETSYIPGSINPIGWGNGIDRYALSLFWAIQSVTSIGYGNIAPVSRVEFYVANIIMLMSGVFWAWAIGNIIQILGHVDHISLEHKISMDSANALIRCFDSSDPDKEPVIGVGDPNMTAVRIRRFISSQYTKKTKQQLDAECNSKELEDVYPMINHLSPELKRLSSLHLLRSLLEMIPYLSSACLTPSEQSEVAFKCVFVEFGRGEIFDEHVKYGRGIMILKRGFCISSKKSCPGQRRGYCRYEPIGISDVLVEDDFLGKDERRRLMFASYSVAVFIPRSVVLDVLGKKPSIWKQCARWCYLRACLLKWARERNKQVQP
jgi:hypothetical protein